MGFAMFTARKMSLQAKVNDYNAKLMEISNKEEQLANRQAAFQQTTNTATDMFSMIGQVAGGIFGGPVGSALGGGIGGMLGKAVGNSNGNQAQLNAEQKKLDTEKQRLTTLLNKASNELQQVEKAEEQAIKSGTPKYVG